MKATRQALPSTSLSTSEATEAKIQVLPGFHMPGSLPPYLGVPGLEAALGCEWRGSRGENGWSQTRAPDPVPQSPECQQLNKKVPGRDWGPGRAFTCD